jgi:hypothetical protein
MGHAARARGYSGAIQTRFVRASLAPHSAREVGKCAKACSWAAQVGHTWIISGTKLHGSVELTGDWQRTQVWTRHAEAARVCKLRID